MKYRLALNLGSTFLGWCALETEDRKPVGILDMGVRVFDDGRDAQTGEPLAVQRRQLRAIRRNGERRKRRGQRLMTLMIASGLMPADEQGRKEIEKIDPYEVRARALDEKIPLPHLGRALLHISKRRGFKSNRNEGEADDDNGNMKAAIRELERTLASTGARTLGEYLWQQHRAGAPARIRTRRVKNKLEYNFFTDRAMIEQEIDAILAAQQRHHPQLTDDVCAELKEIIFFERVLKQGAIGKCRFEGAEPRARLALPLVQKFLIWQEVNELEVEGLDDGETALDRKEREIIVAALLSSSRVKFSGIRKLLGRTRRFNLETDSRLGLLGASTNILLSDERRFGSRWRALPDDQQEKLIDLLLTESDRERLKTSLTNDWGLSVEQADHMLSLPITNDDWREGIRNGFGNFSKKAILKVQPFLEQGHRLPQAGRLAGYHSTGAHLDERHDLLPYYGKALPDSVIGGTYDRKDRKSAEQFYGRFNNPSVHIGFNQLRKLVNTAIEAHGHPDEIVVSIARDLKQPRDDIARTRAQNSKDIDRLNKELEALNVSPSYRNRMLFSLWEDLSDDPKLRCCPFSGIPIAKGDIFVGDFEETHLLPFSRTFDDRRVNLVLSSREWSRRKGAQSPYEAFGHRADWPQILERAGRLPAENQRRFGKDAWARIKGAEDIVARILTDEHPTAKWARAYLSLLFTSLKSERRLWAVTGQITPLLRHEWGLGDLLDTPDGRSGRDDYRHHALDAVMLGCTDRRLLDRISEDARSLEEDDSLRCKPHQLVPPLPLPFDGLRQQVLAHLSSMVVSLKPDHGGAAKAIRAERPYTVTKLHAQTAYGLVTPPQGNSRAFATRVPAESLLTRADIEKVADAAIRRDLLAAVEGLREGGAEWQQAMAAAIAPGGIMKNGIRRVRVHVAKADNIMVGVNQPSDKGTAGAQPFKYYALRGNYCADVFCVDKGKKAGLWQSEVISNYAAHQKDFVPKWRRGNPTARLIMRLHKNDMVAYEHEGARVICKVKKLAHRKYGAFVFLREHTIENEERDTLTWNASALQLQQKNARKLSIDIMGRVRDPKLVEKQAQAA